MSALQITATVFGVMIVIVIAAFYFAKEIRWIRCTQCRDYFNELDEHMPGDQDLDVDSDSGICPECHRKLIEQGIIKER